MDAETDAALVWTCRHASISKYQFRNSAGPQILSGADRLQLKRGVLPMTELLSNRSLPADAVLETPRPAPA
jgi:hypothetical protein